jgi:hypothetical protein
MSFESWGPKTLELVRIPTVFCLPPVRERRQLRRSLFSKTLYKSGGNMEFVMFEDVDGLEVFVNPEHVIWVRELPNQTTVISCGHDDKFAVRLAPAHAVAALGKTAR